MIREANLTFGPMDARSRTTAVYLHHAAAVSCTVEDVHRWHLANGWAGIGYHYFVRKDGEIWRGRPEDRIGAHAYGHNAESIGVCFEGNYETDDRVMPSAQKDAGIALLRDLMRRYGPLDVFGHRDANATACPGKYFPFEEIKSAALTPEPAEPSAAPEGTLYRVQAGAFAERSNAEGLAERLKSAGFPAILVEAGEIYRVQVGAYAVKSNAEAMAAQLRAAGFAAALTDGGTPSGASGGAQNDKVLRFQRAAQEAGYALPRYGSDGKWGAETESAARRALVRQGSAGPLARLAQELLVEAGYPLPTYGVDGTVGAETVGQIKAFQRAHGLSADGVVGRDTWAALLGETA